MLHPLTLCVFSLHAFNPSLLILKCLYFVLVSRPLVLALSILRDLRVQASVCFSVLVCSSWTLCFHLWKRLFSVLVNKPINDGLGDYVL